MIIQAAHSYMGSYDERFEPHVQIGKFCSIGSGVVFYGTCQHPQTVSSYPFADLGWCDESVYPKSFSKGRIVIGNDVWIGEDVTIMDGVTIGDGAIIGCKAVVRRDVPPYAIVIGNPGEVVRYRHLHHQREKLLETKWWDKSDEEIRRLLPFMKDVEEFLKRV